MKHDDKTRAGAATRAAALFRERYGAEPGGVLSAPGRVNLIGDHTDYVGGFVLPAALKLETAIAYRKRTDGTVRALSEGIPEKAQFKPGQEGVRGWAAYLAGVAWVLQGEGMKLSGLDIAVASDVPRASGLSSSAALEVATARVWREVDGLTLDDKTLALLCQRAENQYVGVPCGIMDQFAVSVPGPGEAILLDCSTLDYQVLALPQDWAFMVTDSGASRQLAGSAYQTRVSECRQIEGLLGLPSLRELTLEHLSRLEGDLHKRARHILYENERVQQAAQALEREDIRAFGELMTDSHRSLRDDYEVSSDALNQLVEAGLNAESCYGGRLTGAGFGGCTVHLVASGREDAFEAHVSKRAPKARVVAVV